MGHWECLFFNWSLHDQTGSHTHLSYAHIPLWYHIPSKKKEPQHIEQFGLCDLQKDSEWHSLFSDGLYRGANEWLTNPRGKENFHTGFCVCTITKLTFDTWRHAWSSKTDAKLVFDPAYFSPSCQLYLFTLQRSMFLLLAIEL